MVEIMSNPYRGEGLPGRVDAMRPSGDAGAVARLLALCPAHGETPLTQSPALARAAGVGAVWIKDERGRMGLGSFKALGAAYCIAHDADQVGTGPWEHRLQGRTYATASAGNHGMSVAAGARVFGAHAVIYLAGTVPDAFAARLRAQGARVVRAGADYEASMRAAAADADANGWTLLSDSTWEGMTGPGYRVMEGYLQMAAEAAAQIGAAPTHILLQAGVGGLAAAFAGYARQVWGAGPRIVVVEPEAAPALIESIRAGRLVDTQGPVSAMGRLDCKTGSMVALDGLARDADVFVTITEAEAEAAMAPLAAAGLATTPSGGAGLAALLSGVAGIGAGARVLCFLSEGPEDG